MLKTKGNEGITLVALVVTVIVLIILAAVTINLVVGQNGIITRTQQGVEDTKKASALEEIQIHLLGLLDDQGNVQLDNIESLDGLTYNSSIGIVRYKGYKFQIDNKGNIPPTNLINYSEIEQGAITDASGQEVLNGGLYRLRTGYINVNGDKNYSLSVNDGYAIRAVHYYDNDKNWINVEYRDTSQNYVDILLNTPTNCKYVRLLIVKEGGQLESVPGKEIYLSEIDKIQPIMWEK